MSVLQFAVTSVPGYLLVENSPGEAACLWTRRLLLFSQSFASVTGVAEFGGGGCWGLFTEKSRVRV